MLWMTAVSFWRNCNKYALAIVSLALAVLVSCLGLSGLRLLQQATLQPLSFMGGGQVVIIDGRTQLRTSANMIYADPLEIKPFPAAQAEQVLAAAGIRRQTQETLVAPYMHLGNDQVPWSYIAGRNDPAVALNSLRLLTGATVTGAEEKLSMIVPSTPSYQHPQLGYVGWDGSAPGMMCSLSIPRVHGIGDQYEWSVPDAAYHDYVVTGLYDGVRAIYGTNWTELAWLQEQVGGDRPISWIGIQCALTEMDGLKQQLEAEIDELGLQLQVLTVYDLGRMLIGDFERFEQMADYYAPVMLFVALLIVLLNAIALTISRRKELALLRTLGFSLGQIQAMFIVECLITALCGGLAGTAMASLIAIGQSGSATVSWLPFLIAISTTALIGSVTTFVLTGGSLSKTLRNPVE